MERRKRRRGVHSWEGRGLNSLNGGWRGSLPCLEKEKGEDAERCLLSQEFHPPISVLRVRKKREEEEKNKKSRGEEVYLWHHCKSPMMSRSMPTAAMAVQWVLVSQQVSERFPNTCHHHCHSSCNYELVDAVRAIQEVNVRHKMSC